jgi:hypothetical protein
MIFAETLHKKAPLIKCHTVKKRLPIRKILLRTVYTA